jgi:hypothetical protein
MKRKAVASSASGVLGILEALTHHECLEMLGRFAEMRAPQFGIARRFYPE